MELVWNGMPFSAHSSSSKGPSQYRGTQLRLALEGAKGPGCRMVPGLGNALIVVGLKNSMLVTLRMHRPYLGRRGLGAFSILVLKRSTLIPAPTWTLASCCSERKRRLGFGFTGDIDHDF